MIHYVRDSKNRDIVDATSFDEDLRVVIIIENFSRMLLNLPENKRKEFISDVSSIDELRGEFFERNLKKETPTELSKRRIKSFAKKWDLFYVED